MTKEPETFDIRNFAQTMREIIFYRTRQLNRPDDANSFFQAQQEVARLRAKLEKAYRSSIQKAKRKKEAPPELWMFGAFAYTSIVLGEAQVNTLVKLSGNKLIDGAVAAGEPIEAGKVSNVFEKLMPDHDV